MTNPNNAQYAMKDSCLYDVVCILVSQSDMDKAIKNQPGVRETSRSYELNILQKTYAVTWAS